MHKIEVVDFNPNWSIWFNQLKDAISKQLTGFDVTIEHVGSTSVPDLAAKPIIDLDIVSKDKSQIPLIIDKLAELGYIHQGDLGIIGREAFKRANSSVPFKSDSGIQIQHHLYLCVKESIALENHLTLRNYLRENPDAVKQYAELKKSLAKKFPHDIDAYVEGKSDFISSILAKCGFEQDDLNKITDQNKKIENR